MIYQNNLNIDAICDQMDEELLDIADYIDNNYKDDIPNVFYENFGRLCFDFCNKDAIIDTINENLDDIQVTDFEIDDDTNYIKFKVESL